MTDTSDGFEPSLALSLEPDGPWRLRIFAGAILSLASGNVARVSVQTTDGQYHWLEISTRISTDTVNGSGGQGSA